MGCSFAARGPSIEPSSAKAGRSDDGDQFARPATIQTKACSHYFHGARKAVKGRNRGARRSPCCCMSKTRNDECGL
jgi:hypothetical protein